MNYMNIFEFLWKGHLLFWIMYFKMPTITTRQSVMTNTSPHHMPVIGNVHPIKIENGTFDDMTHFLMSWPTFWRQVCFLRHDEPFVVMKYFGLYDKHFYIMTSFTSWQTIDVITNLFASWRVFDFMTNFLTSWCLFVVMTNLLSSWHLFDIMTNLLTSWRNFWRQDNVFHTMTNSLTFLISWWTVWRHDVFWRHSELFDVMTCFWFHDVFLISW